MDIKHLTFVVAVAFVAMSTLPVASAHWRGNDVPAWDEPHEHSSAGHSFTSWATVYSVQAQRLCLNTSTFVITWSSTVDGSCPPGTTPISPVRGLRISGSNDCVDIDSIKEPDFLKVAPRFGITHVTVDWGATAPGPAFGSIWNIADHFAHPLLSAQTGHPDSRQGHDPNPTGATPNHYPVHIATIPGVVQLGIQQTGTDKDPHRILPGIDFGDNDFEFCPGGGSHTYAIDSGTNKVALPLGSGPAGSGTATSLTQVYGGGWGFNDIREIGGDCTYDVTPLVGSGTHTWSGGPVAVADSACSGLIDTGVASFRGANEFPALPLGALISTVPLDPTEPVMYSVCNALPGAGCTNIPSPGSAGRLGNSVGDDAVYSSLSHCIWLASQTPRLHSTALNPDGTSREYRGQQALWGSTEATGRPCWPERLVRTGSVGSPFFPSSGFLSGPGWAPDDLPATPSAVESISLAIDEMGTRPFHQFDSGCAPGTTFDPNDPWCGTGGPTVAPPTEWAYAPNQLVALNAIFQP